MEFRTFRVFIHLLYVLIFFQVALCQEELVPATNEVGLAEESAARQLRIYREALLQGSTEEIQVDAAVSLLLQNTAASRAILLSTLKSNENVSGQGAVCKALVKSRGLSQTIDSIEVFLEPLVQILTNQSSEQAKLAAEAMLLYEFKDIFEFLEKIITDQELSSRSRINAIYALQLRPEPSALRDLIELLDDPDSEVSKAAETALQEAFGIPVGTSRKVWSDILIELRLKSPEEIRKDRLLRQEMKLREVQTERDRWQKLYLDSLNKQYESLKDEDGRSRVIMEMINSDLYPIRIWALQKAAVFPVIGEELRDRLLLLLSDSSREVRLQAAKVFSNMSALNPAETLLAQFEQEQDAEVRLAMFEALGEAVYFAFLPDTQIELPLEVKTQTLAIASEYLESDLDAAVIKGAEVIRKIIELNNLGSDALRNNLSLLLERYKKSVLRGEAIRANLLGILARLCGQGGATDVARDMFEPLFIEALAVEDDPDLRLAAARGLSYVDKVEALKIYKEYNLIQDESLAVKQAVIDLAGQTGDASDLDWLVGLLSDNGQSESVWMAIRSICQRQESGFLVNWLETLKTTPGTRDDYIREILDIAEQKAFGSNDAPQLTGIQGQTILWYWNRKAWDEGAAYLENIGYPEKMTAFPETVNAAAFEMYLSSSTRQGLPQVIQNKLVMEDFDPLEPQWQRVDAYFDSEEASIDGKRYLFENLDLIKPENRPGWVAFLDRIREQYDFSDPNAVVEPDQEAVLEGL